MAHHMGIYVQSFCFPPEVLQRTGITAWGIALHHVRLAGMLGLDPYQNS